MKTFSRSVFSCPETTKAAIKQLAVETAHGTVLVADLRGYTSLAEHLAPARVVPLLEEFFAVLSGATELYGGQVFQIAGDGMTAGFGFGDASLAGAREGFAASRIMLERFTLVATRWRREFSMNIGMGVGLHFGEVALGYFGPRGRKAATLVGDTVNVTTGLCGLAHVGEVLLSGSVVAKLGEASICGLLADPDAEASESLLQLPQCKLRGRTAPLEIWARPGFPDTTVKWDDGIGGAKWAGASCSSMWWVQERGVSAPQAAQTSVN